MKLSDVEVDPDKIEKGDWVGEKYGLPIPDMGDLCLKVRGVNNADWRALQGRLLDAVPRKYRVGGRLSPDEQDRITSACLRDACLLDWGNVEGDGDVGEKGKPVPYDKKAAHRLLTEPQYRRFREAVVWAATVVGEQEENDRDEIKGN
jgi:hypothetical protein